MPCLCFYIHIFYNMYVQVEIKEKKKETRIGVYAVTCKMLGKKEMRGINPRQTKKKKKYREWQNKTQEIKAAKNDKNL